MIALTLPPDPRYATVARIVVGGLAARLGLTYEALDDLQLAVESVLSQPDVAAGANVTVEAAVHDSSLELAIGPVHAAVAQGRLGGPEALALETVLAAVVDSVSVENRSGAAWLVLTKRSSMPSIG